MPEIVLTDEQIKIVSEAKANVEVRDHQGNYFGTIAPGCGVSAEEIAIAKRALASKSSDFTPEEIEEARQDLESDQPRYTTAEVLEHLRSLERQ